MSVERNNPHVAESRLYRRHYCADVRYRGLKSPRLFKFTSFRRFRSTFILQTSFIIPLWTLIFCYIEEAHTKGTIKRAKTKFCCGNAPRPLAGHFFAVEMLGDPSPTVFSLWKCSATPRSPFFRCRNAPRPLAGRFFAVGMLGDPSRTVFSLWKCFPILHEN